MADIAIRPGEDNIVHEEASNPQVHVRPGGIGGRVLIRISVGLAAGPHSGLGSIGSGLGATSATNLVFHLSPWEAARLRDELSTALGELGS
jgi:hypothetical protein